MSSENRLISPKTLDRDVTPIRNLVDPPRQGGLQVSPNVAAARLPEFFEEDSSFLVRKIAFYGWVARALEAKTIAMDDKINVEPFDKSEDLG